MHFSIPDTEEFSDNGGSIFMGYNIYINGTYHCTVRYRQLLSLHEQLRRELGPAAVALLPPFPPKRLLPLSPNQLEERRAVLEKYIQTVSQDVRVASSELFTGFLLCAQVETSKETSSPVELDIYLMNGQRFTLEINATSPSHQVLECLAQKIHLPSELVSFFSLFLIRRDDECDIAVIKKLQDFEAPYISLKFMEGMHRVVLRKSFWDVSVESALLEDRVALNLLYSQATAEVEKGWIVADRETRDLLTNLQSRGDKQDYLDLARGLKYYGFIQFKPCWCDYPRPGTRVSISAGSRELNFRVQLSTPDGSSCSGSSDSVCGEVVREGSFRVTRMRCWRITTLHNDEQSSVLGGQISGIGPRLELSFEYLMAKDRLQWVTVCSEQAILMSTCLQDMVAELLLKKNGGITAKSVNRIRNSSWSFMHRDGSSQKINRICKSISSDGLSETSHSSRSQDSTDNSTTKSESHSSTSSIRRLSEKLSSVALKASGKASPSSPAPVPTNPFVENDAFEGIGDEDL